MDNRKRKIALLTLWNNANHGSALQAFALCKYITDLGYHAEYFLYDSRVAISRRTRLERKIRCFVNSFKLSRIRGAVNEDVKVKNGTDSYLIHQFWEQIPHSCVVYNKETCMSALELYDCFIVGGDQLWNPYITLNNYVYLLDFVVDPCQKYSYSPSFGISRISSHYQKCLNKYLATFRMIGCRDALNTIKLSKHLDKEVVHTVDPVLLLSSSEWEASMESIPVPNNYILCYQLGDTKKIRLFAEELARKKNSSVLYLTNSSTPFSVSNISPGNFIYLIANADYIITDSYHGILFSIVFDKHFVPFYKRGEDETTLDNWRIYDLCYSLGLSVGSMAYIKLSTCKSLNSRINDSKSFVKKILNNG